MMLEMSKPSAVCKHPERWHAYDEMSSEVEVLEFLTQLVQLLKPEVIVETGCFIGHGTYALMDGIRENGFGKLYSCDLDIGNVHIVREGLEDFSQDIDCRVLQCSGVELINGISTPIDLAFLDSGMDTPRIDELRALYPKLSLNGVVAIHDTGPQTFLREKYLGPALRELGMQYIYFDTPRGLTLCKKQPEVYP